jgi:hypothetical protein
MLDQPDHVIAKIAEQARRIGWHAFGHVDAAFGDQRAQRVEGMAVGGSKAVIVESGPDG